MVKTQIQLPDELYRRIKAFAEQREWSLAETLRRAADDYLAMHAAEGVAIAPWHPPVPQELGCRVLDNAELKRLAQEDEPVF